MAKKVAKAKDRRVIAALALCFVVGYFTGAIFTTPFKETTPKGLELSVEVVSEVEILPEYSIGIYRVSLSITLKEDGENIPFQENDLLFAKVWVEYFSSNIATMHEAHLPHSDNYSLTLEATGGWCIFYVRYGSADGRIASTTFGPYEVGGA